jgi:hypothetical protein
LFQALTVGLERKGFGSAKGESRELLAPRGELIKNTLVP